MLEANIKKILENILAHKILDEALFFQAITHRSVLADKTTNDRSYERLEFLGDRVLGLAVANLLYRTFPNEPEGLLSRRLMQLVSKHQIAERIRKLKLHQLMRLSNGEYSNGGQDNPTLQADLGEALIGALWLDDTNHKGQAAFDFVETQWASLITLKEKAPKDAKSALQEWCMARKLPLPDYQLIHQEGPSHAPQFTIALLIEGQPSLEATGASIQGTQKILAQTMLARLTQ